jgi:hypothetical protein
MSDTNNEHGDHAKKYEFSVDSHDFESELPALTGAQIKAKASIDPTFGLFREGRHGHSDQQIRDDESVDLRHKNDNEFHTMPPATFGRD